MAKQAKKKRTLPPALRANAAKVKAAAKASKGTGGRARVSAAKKALQS